MWPSLLQPPVWRFSGPVIDAHCHFGEPAATGRMLKAGRLYGVSKWVGICGVGEVPAIRKRWGDQVAFNVWTEHRDVEDARRFTERNLRIVEQARKLRCSCIKFWYKPEFNESRGLFFDDPRLDRVFQAMIDAGLPALVHIADPDVWWRHRYHDARRFETKAFTYRQLTNTLRRFPDMKVVVAHMGGWPENLPFLATLLANHANVFLDTSGTKWIARELSAQPAAARAFIIRHADRLLFGSDLVAFKQATVEHHCSRYYVHRHLYERNEVRRSPIEDPDAGGEVFLAGLDLPAEVLSRLYADNARDLFTNMG